MTSDPSPNPHMNASPAFARRIIATVLLSLCVLSSSGCATLDTHPNLVEPELVALSSAGFGFMCGLTIPVLVFAVNSSPTTVGFAGIFFSITGAFGSGLGAWQGAPEQPREAHRINAGYGACIGSGLGAGIGGYFATKRGAKQPEIPPHVQKKLRQRYERGGSRYPHLERR